MTRILIRGAIGLLAVSSVSTLVVADDMGEVTVQASRVVSKTVGKTASGIPIVDVSLSYGVSAKDLDLSSHAGFVEMQKRVNDAAQAACKELSRQYPDSSLERCGLREDRSRQGDGQGERAGGEELRSK